MKYLIVLVLAFGQAFAADFHEFKIKGAKGKDIDFSQYKGEPVLVVNIATKCGYTPQLDDLEKLSQKYSNKMTVVGVPSNDFGGQTPEGDKKVAEFCRLNYGVSFPLTTKIKVKGEQKHPLYAFLTGEGDEVGWNFEKFLLDKEGKVVGRFRSGVEPLSDELTGAIDKLVK